MIEDRKYSWEADYIAAVLETDDARLAERINKANAALATRLNELASDHGGTSDEQVALTGALNGLLVLMKERYPASLSSSANKSADGDNQPLG